eukprot:TRINITY_DN6764_c0_g2_i1.p1 TRINITY_DN6764_c0_g2~~TRINITY_DN6764_c0_g2_i1.p1  ORF type:complete len:358 (+),score=51.48 TRINITY_DN6764_c0_g2_i1:117-1190(+)
MLSLQVAEKQHDRACQRTGCRQKRCVYQNWIWAAAVTSVILRAPTPTQNFLPAHTSSKISVPLPSRTAASGYTVLTKGRSKRMLHSKQAVEPNEEPNLQQSRRHWLAAISSGALLATFSGKSSGANAFANRVVEPAQKQALDPAAKTKTRRLMANLEGIELQQVNAGGGSALGNGQLRGCGEKSLNCFSPTAFRTSGLKTEPWIFKGKASLEEVMAEIRAVVDAYPPGQSGIDAGGFQVAESKPKYLRVEYESRRFGYIDDVEFQLQDPGKNTKSSDENTISGRVSVRSASRVGIADYGVNSVRLNRLAADLRAKGGWEIKDITPERHRKYFEANCARSDNILPLKLCRGVQSSSGT